MQEDLAGTQVRRRTRRRVVSDDDLPLTQVLLAFSPTWRLEGWCWSQELQVILLIPVVMMVTPWEREPSKRCGSGSSAQRG